MEDTVEQIFKRWIPVKHIKSSSITDVSINLGNSANANCRIVSKTWSRHFNKIYLSKYSWYHFVHVMYNEDGFELEFRDKKHTIHYCFMDIWPDGKRNGKALLRVYPTNDPSVVDKFFKDAGFIKHIESKEKKETFVFWKDIVDYLEKVLSADEKVWTIKTLTLEQMKEADETEKWYNCKLFCRRFWEHMQKKTQLKDGKEIDKIKFDDYLWTEYKGILTKLLIYLGTTDNSGRIDVLVDNIEQSAVAAGGSNDLNLESGRIIDAAESITQLYGICLGKLEETNERVEKELEHLEKLKKKGKIPQTGYEDLKNSMLRVKGTDKNEKKKILKEEYKKVKEKLGDEENRRDGCSIM